MFRLELPGSERPDPTEEKKKVQKDVLNNFVMFGILVVTYRLLPLVLDNL